MGRRVIDSGGSSFFFPLYSLFLFFLVFFFLFLRIFFYFSFGLGCIDAVFSCLIVLIPLPIFSGTS